MALVFKNIRWKNFLSTGDNFTEISFSDTRTSLIVGHNGAGKSTLLDALSFALFGKAHRSIKNDQLINSINEKGLRIEVELEAHGYSYQIIRGLKPKVFEIWREGEMLNQDSHAKEYQKILEQNILKLNHKSFHQIVVLGSSSFIPFMQLATPARREVIEDLLDIGVFSKMNLLMKERNSALREQAKTNLYNINIIENKIESQKKYIADINSINQDQKAKHEASIKNFLAKVNELQEENEVLAKEIDNLSVGLNDSLTLSNAKKQKLLQYQGQFSQKRLSIVREAQFYDKHDVCPTCTQSIDETLRKTKIEEASTNAQELQSALSKVDEELEKLNESINELVKVSGEVNTKNSRVTSNNRMIHQLESSIAQERGFITSIDSSDTNTEGAINELRKYTKDREALLEEKVDISDKVAYNSVIGEMIKDTGIKTKIIKQYIPIINKLVNQYLQVLDFFVHFELDENFGETIRSRHRDHFSYDSFSEGEKQRIDLALLFTWRAVAKMKNSVATNLLILDETFDSSLDYDGVDNLMKILYTLDDDTNVFVISHKGDILEGRFDRKIEFTKTRNFSKIHFTQYNGKDNE